MTRKILIVYATAGIGHKKAALGVKKALDETSPKDTEVVLIDALDYAPPFFKWLYLKLYLLAVNRLPLVWGFLYYLTDNYYVNIVVSKIRRFNNSLNSAPLVKYLAALNPDIIISTHFFASEVAADAKRNGLIESRIITVLTDYRLHSWWVSDHVDTYVVGSEDARGDLIRWGIPVERIKVLGIPIEPVFSKPLDKDSIRERFGMRGDVFTVLVIGGGFGVGPIEDIVKTLGTVSNPVQAIVVCGHNEELVSRMEALKAQSDILLKILGFVDNVYEFMEIADILISKAGGITVTESLAKNLPMIVISPILGQETRNSEFLISHGAGLMVKKPSELKEMLEGLISDPDKMNRIREAIGRIKRPRAAYEIGHLALEEKALS